MFSVHFYNRGLEGLLKFTKTLGALCDLFRLEDVQEIALWEFRQNWNLGIGIQVVTKILASLLFKVELEHMACVCGKNVSFVLNLRNHFTHVVMGRAGKLHAWFTGAGLTPVNLFMAQTADQNACSLRQTDTFKRLSHTPATPNGKVTPSPRGRDGRQQRGSRTGRLNHRVWIVSLYLFPCDKYKALR